jgi:MerR family transcriptional regulator, light-induced transcriptional regulator
MPKDLLTSTDAAEFMGVGVSSIKRWADEGLLPCVRTAGGHRRFERAALLEHAERSQAVGLEKVETARWMATLASKGSLHEVTGALHLARHRHGSWWRVARELGEVLAEVGRQWADGLITILDEHAMTERLRRGLTMVTESMPSPPTAPVALLMTAEGEEHTMGLSLVELCAREAGWATRWAGSRTPFTELDRALSTDTPALLAVSASMFGHSEEALRGQCEALEAIAERHGVMLALGGQGPWPAAPRFAWRVWHFESLHKRLLKGRPS